MILPPKDSRWRRPLKPAGLTWIFIATLALGAIVPPEPAAAQRRGGGFFAQLFGTGQNNNRNQPRVSASQVRINRALQTALNFFGFDAGPVDGIMGRRSRAAVSAFQAFMGYEDTGRLTREESRLLLTAYSRIALQDEALALKVRLGLVEPQTLLTAFAAGEITPTDPESENPESESPAPEGPPSMRVACVDIGASGPQELLTAQFCNLRQLAMEQSDFLVQTALGGQSLEPVREECRNFAEDMRPLVAQLASRSASETRDQMALWSRRSGLSEEKLSGRAETCLGLAYRQDDGAAALASLLVLSGFDRAIYTEAIGYHLALGLGLEAPDRALAGDWLKTAAATLPEGQLSLTAQLPERRLVIIADMLSLLAPPEE